MYKVIKRICSLIGVIAISAITLISCDQPTDEASKDEAAYPNAIYYEGFEDGLGLWGPNPKASDSTAVSIDTSLGANGTSSSLYLDNSSESGDFENGAAYITFPDGITPSYISYYVRYKQNITTTGAEYALAVIFYDNTDTSNAITTDPFYSEFSTDGTLEDYIYFDDATSDPYTLPNAWYQI
jgi:hypothetical protein